MSWSADPWGEAPWSAGVVPSTTPPGQTIPPPIPGATTQYSYARQTGILPWSLASWSGGFAPSVYQPGGIVASPNPDTGTCTIYAWWPYASKMLLVRVTPDGVRTPVRGGYPLAAIGSTRINACPNPSVEAGLNGYVPGTGSPTLGTVTRTDLDPSDPDTTAWTATISAAGTNEVTVPLSLASAQIVTVGIDLSIADRPTALTITIGWTDSGGNALASSVATLTSNQVGASISQYGRAVVYLQPPVGAFAATNMKVAGTGLPAGDVMSGDRITVEKGRTDGSYFDGDVLGGLWTGATQLSTSIAAPVATVVDGECPLDVPVTYQVFDPDLVGGSASASSVVLASNGQAWLGHPLSPSAPIPCTPTEVPTVVHALPQAILPVMGRPKPVVVTSTVRQAPSGAIKIGCGDFADRAALLALLADAQPLLFRAPAEYGFGYGQWLTFSDISEDAGGRLAWQQARVLSANYQEVDAPAAVNLVAA